MMPEFCLRRVIPLSQVASRHYAVESNESLAAPSYSRQRPKSTTLHLRRSHMSDDSPETRYDESPILICRVHSRQDLVISPGAIVMRRGGSLYHLQFMIPFLHDIECPFLLSFVGNQTFAIKVILKSWKQTTW